jgi:tetratricopeptide (TPR) repeat protein
LLAYGFWYVFQKYVPKQTNLYLVPALALLALYSVKTIARAPIWKNDISLHLNDVLTYPNSTMLNGNACTRLIELSELPKNKDISNKLLDSAKIFGSKSLKLHDRFVNSYLNMGIVYLKQGRNDSAAYYWSFVRKFYPSHPQLAAMDAALNGGAVNKARDLANKGDLKGALAELKNAEKSSPKDPGLLKDIANLSYSVKDYQGAHDYALKCLSISPGDTQMVKLNTYLQSVGIK